MKIVVDINHPAHVHYFKNFIWEMEKRGHEILITASEKEISYQLLDLYGFDYIRIGNYGKKFWQKLLNIPVLDWKMFLAVKKFKPDLFIGFGSIRAAHISRLLGKPFIALDDSEPSPLEHILYVPFADAIITPECFRKDFGKKQYRYNGYIEMAYLHPHYFTPDDSVLSDLGENGRSKYVLLRFVSWQAIHDIGKSGFSLKNKINLVNELKKFATVYISSETSLPFELEQYRVRISPEKIHHILFYAHLFVSDSQTMTTESALLGTPAVRCNSFVGKNDMGNFIELEQDFGLIFNFDNVENAIRKSIQLMQDDNLKQRWTVKRENLMKNKTDVTEYLVSFVTSFSTRNR